MLLITRRSAFVGLAIAVLWKERGMAADWTRESFEAHINAVFDDIESKAKAATSISDIGPLQDRLDEEWYGPKPGAFLPRDVFDRLSARLGRVSDTLVQRFVTLKKAGVNIPTDKKIIVEHAAPSLDTFFYALHYSNKDQPTDQASRKAIIRSTEEKLDIVLPERLRDLYLLQNGGHTDFYLATDRADPQYEFSGEASAVINTAYDAWKSVLPGKDVTPLESLRTLGAVSDGIDFGDADTAWRKYIPEIDRLIPISNHGSDIWLCLDCRESSREPKVVLFDDTREQRSGKRLFAYEASDFATFFAALRRHAITVEDGQNMRGLRIL